MHSKQCKRITEHDLRPCEDILNSVASFHVMNPLTRDYEELNGATASFVLQDEWLALFPCLLVFGWLFSSFPFSGKEEAGDEKEGGDNGNVM